MTHFLESEYAPRSPERARFHVIPVPLERTVSYGGGTNLGPEAILRASQQLEAWDGISAPGELGIFTHDPVDCSRPLERIFADVEEKVACALRVGAVPVTLGGEHTVSYAPMAALHDSGTRFGIVHFDAHADLRDVYEEDPFSHACVLRRVVEHTRLPLAQFGTREYCREEAEFRAERGIVHFDARKLAVDGLPAHPLPADFPENIYVTFDVDGFDSSLMPATGTPAPGGLFWHDALTLLERCLAGRRLMGFDVVELAPIEGLHHCDYTAARLVHCLMGMAQRSLGL